MQSEIPIFLYEELLQQYGKELTTKIIDGYSQKRPVTFRVNTLKTNSNAIKELLQNENIHYQEVPWSSEALILKNTDEKEIRSLSIYENGEIYLQSLSSMLPALILKPKPNENILDMAAAPRRKNNPNSKFITK